MDFDQPPVVRVEADATRPLDPGAWPMTVPAAAQLVRDGLDLPRGVTFLVGENGSGKSTLVEALAIAFGLSPEGGSPYGRHSTRPTESPLSDGLRMQRGIGAARYGFFLRAETMHGWYTFSEEHPPPRHAVPRFHEMSHGESFLEVLRTRFAGYGFFVLDEPESALSFRSCLARVALLDDLRTEGAQVLCATHLPLLASLPGATLLELGEHGLRPTTYEDLDLVRDWRAFLTAPDRYLRHLLGP